MDVEALRRLPAEQQHQLYLTLLEDNFFVPVQRMEIERSSGEVRIRYLRTVVAGEQPGEYLLLFTRKNYWDSLGSAVPALVRPPLDRLHADLGDTDVVVDLGSPRPFVTTLTVLTALQAALKGSA